MEQKGYVSVRFIIFLKATLGKMVATNILGTDFLDLHFWQVWPKKFYNVKSYESSKRDIEKDKDEMEQDRDLEPSEESIHQDREPSQMLSSTVK